jgi:DNA-binding transcriptional LysR family regulator
LHVSQPALSKRLRGLECLVGVKLLERSTCGVSPTPAGQRLYGAAQRLLADVDEVEAALADLASWTPPVRVAASATVAELWLTQLLVEFASFQGRHVSIEVTTANSTRVLEMVREGRSELGLAAIDPRPGAAGGLRTTVLWESEAVVAVPCAHPWAEVEAIEPEEFARTPIIRSDPGASSSRVVDAELQVLGLQQTRPLAEIGDATAAMAAALTSGAPVLMPLRAASEPPGRGLVIRRVRGLRFELRFGLAFAGSLDNLTPSARRLADYLLELERARHAA